MGIVIGLIVLALVVVIIGGYFMTIYNGLIAVKNNIDKAWANIDVLLKQRHDELPKLIETCKGYMAHEAGVFDRIMKARQSLMSASGPAQKGQAEGELQGSLRQLFALAENYPNLKAQSSFQQLQERITGLESQIADRREFYNDSVNTYNIRIASLPDAFVASMLHLTPREMYKVDAGDREDVKVDFSAHPAGMKSYTDYLVMHTPERKTLVNITDEAAAVVKKSSIKEGFLLVSAMHITAGVFVNDEESGLKKDIMRMLERLAPVGDYEHHKTGEDNGDAHLKRMLVNHQVILPITKGKLDLGPWEQLFYAEFDGQRDKRVILKALGE